MNSLKSFMNKVSDRVREVNPGSPHSGYEDGVQPGGGDPVEGFLCPTCLLSLPDPEALQEHYEAQHLDPSANYLCPVCKTRLTSAQELEDHYLANHNAKDTTGFSMEALREEISELSTNLREEKWHSEELGREVERLQEAFKKTDSVDFVHSSQLEAVVEARTLLSSEVVLLRKQLAEALEQKAALRVEKDGLEMRSSQVAVERAHLRASLDSLQSEKVSLESELCELRLQISHDESREKNERQKLTEELTKTAKEAQFHQETASALQNDLKGKSELAASLNEEIRLLKQEVDALKKKLQDKESETDRLAKQLDDTNITSSTQSELISELRSKSANYEENIQALESQVCDMKEMQKMSNTEATATQRELVALQDRLNSTLLEKDTVARHLQDQEVELENLKEQMSDVSREESEIVQRKSKQIEELRGIQKEWEHRCVGLECREEESKVEIERRMEELRQELKKADEKVMQGVSQMKELQLQGEKAEQKWKETVELMEGKLGLVEENKNEVEQKLNEAKGKLTKLKGINVEMEGNLSAARNERDSSTELLRITKEKLSQMEGELAERKVQMEAETEVQKESNRELRECQLRLEGLQRDVETRTDRIIALEQELTERTASGMEKESETEQREAELMEHLNSKQKRIEEVMQKLHKMQEDYQSEVEAHKKLRSETEDLRGQLDVLVKNWADGKKEVEKSLSEAEYLKKQLLDCEQNCEDLQDSLQEIESQSQFMLQEKKDLKVVIKRLDEKLLEEKSFRDQSDSNHITQLATERDLRIEVENKLVTVSSSRQLLEQQLTDAHRKNSDQLAGMKVQLESKVAKVEDLEGRLSAMEAELVALAGDKLELEVRAEASVDERKLLLERCVAAESEAERLRTAVTAMRRQLDEAAAAVHELGRENQNLQIETSRLSNRKWADDSEVQECQKCSKGFTVTVRRHHCRNCGQIFCKECSSRQAPLELNKRAVRVCDGCFKELGDRG